MAEQDGEERKAVRSGYARDVLPSAVDATERDGLAVLPAGERQIRQRPEDFVRGKHEQPKTKTYKDVLMSGTTIITRAAASAEPNSGKRVRRTAPPAAASEQAQEQELMHTLPRAAGRTAPFDPFTPGEPDPETGAEPAYMPPAGTVIEAPGDEPVRQPYAHPATATAAAVIPRYAPAPAGKKLVMGLADGDLHLRAKDVLLSPYGIAVLMPMDGMLFMPKPGTELTLAWDDKHEAVYFPGVTFDLDMIQCMVLIFIKQGI